MGKRGQKNAEGAVIKLLFFELQSLISFACTCFIVSSSFSQVLQSSIGSELFAALAKVYMVNDM